MKNLVNVSDKEIKISSRNLPEDNPPSDSLIYVEENSLKTSIRENIPGVDRENSRVFLKWGLILSFLGHIIDFAINNLVSLNLFSIVLDFFTISLAFVALLLILLSSIAFLFGSVSSGFRKAYIVSERYIISTYTGERKKNCEWIKLDEIDDINWKNDEVVFIKDNKRIKAGFDSNDIEKIQNRLYF